MKLTMSSLLMVASFMLLCTIMTVQAQTSPLLNSSLSHYAVTVFELRAQGTCNLTCQEISPLHCDIGQRYTIFRPSSVSSFPPTNANSDICEISWPIVISQTPMGADIAFYKKNLPNVPDGASYVIVFLYFTSTGDVRTFGNAVDASCNSWQTFNASTIVNDLQSGVSIQRFLLVVSRFNRSSEVGVRLTCPEIRSLFFLEADVEGALNSNFFDSGVPIEVTKELEPPVQTTDPPVGTSCDLLRSDDISLPDDFEELPIPITQFFPVFGIHTESIDILQEG